jgi:hypothetical protein
VRGSGRCIRSTLQTFGRDWGGSDTVTGVPVNQETPPLSPSCRRLSPTLLPTMKGLKKTLVSTSEQHPTPDAHPARRSAVAQGQQLQVQDLQQLPAAPECIPGTPTPTSKDPAPAILRHSGPRQHHKPEPECSTVRAEWPIPESCPSRPVIPACPIHRQIRPRR